MKVFISTKEIIKKFRIPYIRINYLTKRGILKVAKKHGNKRLYDLEEVEPKLRNKAPV